MKHREKRDERGESGKGESRREMSKKALIILSFSVIYGTIEVGNQNGHNAPEKGVESGERPTEAMG